MSSTRSLALLGAASAVAAPTAIAIADAKPASVAPGGTLRVRIAGEPTVRSQMRHLVHRTALRDYRHAARRAGDKPSAAARFWSNAVLARATRDLRRKRADAFAASAGSTPNSTAARAGGAPSGTLAAIAQCESGGNPAAVGGGGTFRGLYQFDQGTWQSVGGSGDPAAASVAEQTRRAQILYSRAGSSPWPVCGR